MVNMICDATPVGSVEEMKLAKRATLGRPKPPEWRKRVSAILADQSHGGEGGERAHSGKTNRTQRGGTRRVAGDFGRTNRTQMGEVAECRTVSAKPTHRGEGGILADQSHGVKEIPGNERA